jgi:hypothetical protein
MIRLPRAVKTDHCASRCGLVPVPQNVASSARHEVASEGSAAQVFFRRLGTLDFVNSIIMFGASLLLSVLPFIILPRGRGAGACVPVTGGR